MNTQDWTSIESETLRIEALIALVNHQAAWMAGDIAEYGELQWNPRTPEVIELEKWVGTRPKEMNDD